MPDFRFKTCRRCHIRKPVEYFWSNGKPSHCNGISAWKAKCKACEQAEDALKKLGRLGK